MSKGDREAFELIYRKYVSDLYRYARKSISKKEDCEEIIQDVFVSLWVQRKKLRINSTLRGYLMGMVRYSVIRAIRNSVRLKKHTEHFRQFEAAYPVVDPRGPEPLDLDSALDKAISDLPVRCQMALRLRLTERLKNADIATRMSITTRTVEGYISNAYIHLRTVLPEYMRRQEL